MQAEMLVTLATILLISPVIDQVAAMDVTDLPDNQQDREKLSSQQKGRLSLQNTAEIQHCLVSAGDVGCGVFECFENNSCEIQGLHEICMNFLHNAGKFDAQGKSFIKDALKCMAHGLRQKFSCISRKCLAIKEMVVQLQKECYLKHNLCSAAKENVIVMVEMIHFQDLILKGPYVELVNILLSCGEEVKEAITRSVRVQCEQNWGALCDSLGFCAFSKQGEQTAVTRAPEKRHGEGSNKSGSRDPADPSHQHPEPERDHTRTSRGDKEKGSKVHLNAHTRVRSSSQSSRRLSGETDIADEEDPLTTDIRR
ncbi:UNVERIFIED_CONTAM: hypothetical protein FKN15_031024 [Acipenser sinensis]